ncbi:hypothetical protein HOP50_04g28990 [Chloropicon primus]|uniref:Uncharacterized protein n=2 Tax=Chloropicon primus TaxID=1764295 RepID=A0A5B8MLZ5_9CHLO|nr:hypothetical protein A3770_04p29000 [Chloropicon primus]UPQ99591.1 hypothetical protein HOP50_04g28990 [Chloropicon primus]|eukprot:QDZ20382.1 hypothetical protein A3770_04p29000 [Chloropicon primus]
MIIESESDSEDVPLAMQLASKAKSEPKTSTSEAPAARKENGGGGKEEGKANGSQGGGGKVKASRETKKVVKREPTVKREKKVYNMPGQTRETPQENEPVAKFYSSLYKEKPESAMALRWLMQHGMLPKEVAEREFLKAKKAKSQATAGVKKRPAASAANGKGPKKKRGPKKKVDRDVLFA